MTTKKQPKILFFDIETSYLEARIWSLGKQHIRHDQLIEGRDAYDIICIAYAWNDDKPAKVLHWGYEEQDSSKMILEFDKLVDQADIVIGKNSDAFDVKHINTLRMKHKLPPRTDWSKYTDDLQKQMKRHFYFPSHSLDYFNKFLGGTGKDKMEMQDWINIVEKHPKEGKASFKKMLEYNIKDVEDTRDGWIEVLPYIEPKFNHATFLQDTVCIVCGSNNIARNGTRVSGKTLYQTYICRDHGGYAGRAAINKKDVGKIG